jgi:hypothetical protein
MTGPEPYVPAGPVETDPVAFRPDDRRPAIEHVLRGVQLGTWDRGIVTWLLTWDDSTIRTVCSLIERARQAQARSLPWKTTIEQALRDAIRYRTKFNEHPGNAEQVGLYRGAARDLGIDLEEESPPGGAR